MDVNGTLAQLWRYPVKSMLGESLPSLTITPGGAEHDRAYALLDEETGRIASAKQPSRWRTMLQCHAAWTADGVMITLPDDRTVLAVDPSADRLVSEAIGRTVHLLSARPDEVIIARPSPEDIMEHGERADVAYRLVSLTAPTPDSGFVDAAPISLVTTSTLDAVGFEALRYRPNLVVATPPTVPPFVENDWAGRTLRIGDVVLRGLRPIVRCAIPTLEHGELPRATDAVRQLLERNRIPLGDGSLGPCLGAYAEVVQPGIARLDDPVQLG